LLLKSEEEELDKVKQAAIDLAKREYAAPSGPVPCRDEERALTDCYAAGAGAFSRCKAASAAYSKCADTAHKLFLSVK
jgi:hypothetical protein